GASDTHPVSVVITQEMIDGKCYTNTASAEVRRYFENDQPGSEGPSLTEEYEVIARDVAEAQACFTQNAALTLDKQIDGKDTYQEVGDEIGYKYIITNTGTVTIQGPISVTDDKISDLPTLAGPLLVGQTVTINGTYVIKEADITEKSVTNIAFATGSFEGEPVTSNEDSETAEAILLILNEIGTYCELDAPYVRWDLSGINLALLDKEVGPNPITMVWLD